MMELLPTAHVDTFARDNLPPPSKWPTLEFTTEALTYPTHLNAAVELIDVPVARYGPDRVALLTPEGEVWTYGDLQRRTNQIAHVLVDDLGLVPGNRVLLRSPNNPWTVACWLAILKAGGVVVTMFSALPWWRRFAPPSRSSTTGSRQTSRRFEGTPSRAWR
jgi:2-aminobenzoate-CoA ligase